MSIYSLSYHSRNLVEDLTFDTLSEIDKILRVSRSRNAANGVTGALMFDEGRFTQILEGRQDDVQNIFESIRHDRRHADVTILFTQTSIVRRFSSWAMTFVGSTPAARAYYKNYTAKTGLFSKTLHQDTLCQFQQDKLCQLMRETIELDLNDLI